MASFGAFGAFLDARGSDFDEFVSDFADVRASGRFSLGARLWHLL